jgi:Uma2 family endonuclease
MSETAEKRMTIAEFLEWDDGTHRRYELVRGRTVAMAPPGVKHSVIVSKIGGALEAGLKRPCYVGMNAGVIRPDRDDTYYEGDLVVSCILLEEDSPTIPRPVVLIEVLSPSTAEHDRGGKLYDYRRIESVQEIALVASEQRHVEVWRRRSAKWEVEDLIGDAAFELEAVGVAIPFAAIYATAASERRCQ